MKKKKSIVLINLRNAWLPVIYSPGPLLNLGARLLDVGFEVNLIDLNLIELTDASTLPVLLASDYIGINTLGTMMIPMVREHILELRAAGYERPILVGGGGVYHLSAGEFARFFPRNEFGEVRQVVKDEELAPALDLLLRRIPTRFEVSVRSMLERLPLEQRLAYLKREFCLFLSKGCLFRCDFCVAEKEQPEQYRKFDRLQDEVDYIAETLARAGECELRVYISNLDSLQHPEELEQALRIAQVAAGKYSVTFRARGLATTKCTKLALEKDPQVLQRLRACGFYALAFGVDSVSKIVLQDQHKRHSSVVDYEECREACYEAGIQVELLLLVGFQTGGWRPDIEAIIYAIQNAYGRYHVIIRPYLAKLDLPGGKKWREDEATREYYLNNPWALVYLEYSMLLTSCTAPNGIHRWRGNMMFLLLQVVLLPQGWANPPIMPVSRRSSILASLARSWNAWMPPDR